LAVDAAGLPSTNHSKMGAWGRGGVRAWGGKSAKACSTCSTLVSYRSRIHEKVRHRSIARRCLRVGPN
jgi:hypothetical protein